jgi:hypothetical protein
MVRLCPFLHKQVILSDTPAVTDSSSTWMPSWRGWSWGDGIFAL